MADWQMQCCGEPFSVGETVEWTLAPVDDRGSLALAMGQELAETVTHHEDHHGLMPEDAPPTAGTVRSIRAVHGRYGRAEGQGKCLALVRESATAIAVRSADGWEEDQGGARFVGYLIELAESIGGDRASIR